MASHWLFWALIAGLGLTSYNVLFRLASEANMFTFLMIANAVAFVSYFVISRFMDTGEGASIQSGDSKVILWASLTGVIIVLIEIAIFYMLRTGTAGLSAGFPFMNIMALMTTFGIGVLVFKEEFTWQNGLGIAFGLLSVWLLAYKKA